jgi:hypothetical protein
MSTPRTEVIFVTVATVLVLSAMLAIQYVSTTAAYADGWKDKNKGCKEEPVSHKPSVKQTRRKIVIYEYAKAIFQLHMLSWRTMINS